MPPVHALPPSGPSVQITELFNSLHMNIPQILFRIPALFKLLYEPCHYCHRRLSEIDGYPLGRIGWLPYPPKPATHEPSEKKAGEDGEKKDVEGENKGEKKDGEIAAANGEKKEEDKKEEGDVSMADGEKKDPEDKAEGKSEEKKDEDNKEDKMVIEDEKKEDGRWICWHQSCLAQVR